MNKPLTYLLALTCLAIAPVAAPAQDAMSDEAKLLAGLADMDLEPVIEWFAVDPPDNPDEAAALRTALAEGYLAKVGDTPEGWTRAVNLIITLQEGMYANPAYADYYARPMWGADCANDLMGSLRFRNMAKEFALMGFCSRSQREAVDLIAEKSVGFLSSAEDEFYRLRMVLGRQGDALQDLINRGKWAQLEEYTKLQIPFYRAQAIALLATQPDDGPYFSTKSKPEGERKRLLSIAAADAADVLQKANDSGFPDGQKGRILLLRSLIAGMQAKHDQALELARKGLALDLDSAGFTKFTLALAEAKALAESGKADPANAALDKLMADEFTRSHPLHLVLVADQKFLIPLRAALKESDQVRRTAKIGEAFEVYGKVTGDPSLGEWRAAVEAYIENRYEDQLSQLPGDFHEDAMPPALRLAKVKALYNDAEQVRGGGDKAAADALYQQAIAAAASLLQESKLSDTIRAEAMFYRALSHFRKGEAGHAANTFIELADRYPDNARGQTSIETAYIYLTSKLYARSPKAEAIVALHRKAFEVLLGKYPTTDLARTATYEYAAFLREQGEYAKAAEAYRNVPSDHPAAIEAQYERLAVTGAVWAEQRSRPMGLEVLRDSDAFIKAAEQALPQRTGEKQAVLRKYISQAMLLKAQVLIEATSALTEAGQVLDKLESAYADVPGNGPRIMGLRIRVFQKQGKYDEAEKILRDFMQADADRAGPLALQVLQSLNGEIKTLADEGAGAEKVGRLADIAVNLARSLVMPWVDKQQRFTAEQKLAFELMPAESLRRAQKYDQAVELYKALVAKYPQEAPRNIEVVSGLAECHFHLKQFNEARKHYTLIIKNAQQEQLYNSLFWNAQMRWHQMWDDSLGSKKDDGIYRSIENSLRKRRDENLGGEPYKSELLRLRDKHRP